MGHYYFAPITHRSWHEALPQACFIQRVSNCALCKAFECWQLFKGIVANKSIYAITIINLKKQI